jgi:hypothetical protein
MQSVRINASELEDSTNQLIEDVINNLPNKIGLVKNQNEFKQAVDLLINEIFELFRSKYERIKDHQRFKNIFLGLIRSKQDELLNGKTWGNIFSEVRDIDGNLDKDQTYFDAILIYCKLNKTYSRDEVIGYLIEITGLWNVFPAINNCCLNNKAILLDHRPLPEEIKTSKLKAVLFDYGFYNLDLIMVLTAESIEGIAGLLAKNKLPYQIAMFDFLGFISYLEKERFKSKHDMYKEISKWLDSSKDGRSVKGNINSLLSFTTENKDRYTAYKHTEEVKTDYLILK